MKRLILYGLGLSLLIVCLYQKKDEVIGIAAVIMFVIMFSALLMPLCSRLEKKGMRTSLAAGYTVIGFSLLVMIVIAAFIPYLISHSVYLVKRISPTLAALMQQASIWIERIGLEQMYIADQGNMTLFSISRLTSLLAKMGMSFAAQTGRIVFSLVLTYYVLCDRKRIGSHLLLLVPSEWRRSVLAGIFGCRNAVMSYFSGLLKTSVFVSLTTGIGLLVLGVQDAVLLSLFMGVFEMLPYLGPVLAAIPILLSSMTQGINVTIGALIWIIVVQQIEGNFVSPYFTATSTSIHPLAAVAGVFVFGSFFGVWGILIAVPIMVLVQSVFWSVRQTRYFMKEEQAAVHKSFAS